MQYPSSSRRQVRSNTLRAGIVALVLVCHCPAEFGGSTHPYYQRHATPAFSLADFSSDSTFLDLRKAHMPSFGEANTVAEAERLFASRAAAAVSDSAGIGRGVRLFPAGDSATELLEEKSYGDVAPSIYIPTAKCLAVLAYADFFPGLTGTQLRPVVSQAILAASPGWCGTFGPEVHDAVTLAFLESEGNYDLSEMHLLAMAYAYYDELTPDARERLIQVLLATGRIHRPDEDDIVTSGGPPNDWSRAGFVSPLGYHIRIGETENHILLIHTARYLTNQLLYQRDHDPNHDNRRNGGSDRPTCTDLMLSLLRNMLRDDFSEYNAKPYQNETRSALLNLASFAYDHEVRLGARMVLDYISAHMAVSTCDLRRMVPFRRRNETGDGSNHHRADQIPDEPGFMDVGLMDWAIGADPMTEHFAIQAGNVRAFETFNPAWNLPTDGGDSTMEALSAYRLPYSIHDLFVTDSHRRFFQRLHRTPWNETESSRNCDNMEIYAGSPSYLITAGGAPATYSIDPAPLDTLAPSKVAQQLGVAVTTSFMPTSQPSLPAAQWAHDLIQLSTFSDSPGGVENYGVAPDFACGHVAHLPRWCIDAINPNENRGLFSFVDKGNPPDRPGFYLAIYRDGPATTVEAYDTWLHPGLSFADFKEGVWARNSKFHPLSGVEAQYTTQNGNQLRVLIWSLPMRFGGPFTGARILGIQYGPGDPKDHEGGDAGNVTDPFLSGTIMNSPNEAAVVITNPFLHTRMVLDMQDRWHPKRLSDTGEYEEAGNNHEVWVDFDWTGPTEGDFFHPLNSLTQALALVADGGTIRIMPGATHENPAIKRPIRLVAPIGGVKIGGR